MEIPVYIFTGFLESGKSTFIQGTLEDPKFNSGDSTLLLVFEEGIEEYCPSRFTKDCVTIKSVDKDSLDAAKLEAMRKECKAKRVVVEYNGMWQNGDFFSKLPKDWVIYQEVMFADANTFSAYNANMRSLVVDKLSTAEVVIFNRVTAAMDKTALHKIVRGISRSVDIVYESTDGTLEYDEIEDPLPFDINADIVKIEDKDYALWYRDLTEDMGKYNGKTIEFKGLVALEKSMSENSFVCGRHVMTCCAADIAYAGLACASDGAHNLKMGEWVLLRAKISVEYSKLYKKEGPVLYVTSIVKTAPPEEKVATFY